MTLQKIRNGYEIRKKKLLSGGGVILRNGDVLYGDKVELGKILILYNKGKIIYESDEIIGS